MSLSPRVKHLIVTRFNCRFTHGPVDRELPIRSQPGWLNDRFRLFERFCLPTIKAQTNQNFTWLIFFDEMTPRNYIDHARALIASHPNILLKFCAVYGSEILERDITEMLRGQCDWLLTTRLDNDDGLNSTFVAQLQGAIVVGRKEAINFPTGLIYSEGRTYISHQPSNAFLSMSEPFAGFQTVLRSAHNEMSRYVTIRDVDGTPAWLQVIHQTNVSNKLRGRRILRRQVPAGFETVAELTDAKPLESAAVALIENVTLGVYRAGRDTAARTLRRMRRMVR